MGHSYSHRVFSCISVLLLLEILWSKKTYKFIMNPLFVLSALFASVLAAPQDREGKWLGAHHAVVGAHPAVVNAHPVVGAAQVVNVAHHTVAAPRVGTAPLQIAAPLPPPHPAKTSRSNCRPQTPAHCH